MIYISWVAEANKPSTKADCLFAPTLAWGTAFAFQLSADGCDGLPSAAYKDLENGGKLIVLAEMMPTLFMGQKDAVRLNGDPNDRSKTIYWGRDSYPFMKEVFSWLLTD